MALFVAIGIIVAVAPPAEATWPWGACSGQAVSEATYTLHSSFYDTQEQIELAYEATEGFWNWHDQRRAGLVGRQSTIRATS